MVKKESLNYKDVGLFFVGLLFLATTFFLRFKQTKTVFIGSLTYEHLAALSHQESSSLIQKLFVLVFTLTPSWWMVSLFSLVIFIITFFVVRSIIFSLTDSTKTRYIALVLLLVTPGLLHFFVGFSLIQLIIILLLLICRLFIWLKEYERKNKSWKHRSYYRRKLLAGIILLIILLSFVHLLTAGIVLIYLLLDRWFAHQKIFVYWTASLFFLFFILGLVYVPELFVISFTSLLSINALFSFFGAPFGFSLLLLVFGLGGFVAQTKKTSLLLRLILTLIFILSIWFTLARCVALFVLIFYTAQSITSLLLRSWSLAWLKEPFFILLLCILLFSSFSAVQDMSVQSPSLLEQDAFGVISSYHQNVFFTNQTSKISAQKNNMSSLAFKECTILVSDDSLANVVRYYTGLQTISDFYIFNQEKNVSESIFEIANAQKIFDELTNRNVCFIYESLSEDEIHESQEGLSFIMRHSSRFTPVYEKETIQIYTYTPYA